MVTRIGTAQRKTRHKFLVHYRNRGKISVSKFLQEFDLGQHVNLKINSQVQEGRFYPRFHGLNGVISGKRGSCYQVTIKDQDKTKILYVHPIHLQKQ